jgi:hypothetical protein
VSAAPRAWEKLAAEYPWLIGSPAFASRFRIYPHPLLAQRMEGLRATVREIESLRSEGHALIPSER